MVYVGVLAENVTAELKYFPGKEVWITVNPILNLLT